MSRPPALLGLALLLAAVSGCAKIVGIEDTRVTRGDESAGRGGSTPGSAGSPSAGTSNAGQGNGGASLGGAAASAGGGAGGSSAGDNSAGGSSGAGSGGAGSGGVTSQAGNAGSAGASECPCSAPKPTCENGKCVVRGPTMAKATSYYVDSTEVSKAQYGLFLAAKANGSDTSGQLAECSWNQSYLPDGPAVGDARPIVNVDWCDAAAYCAWADKRLCGAIGGGALGQADLNDPDKGQMYSACAGPDNERYPYGGFSLEPDACNEYFSGSMADVGKFAKCEGHYAGIFDLVGNAAEWIDSCDTAGGADHSVDNCQLGGGSFINDMYTCQTYFDSPRNDHANVFGFRCCSK